MPEILSVRTMRESDAAAIAAGTPGHVLMGRAGEAIVRAGAWKAPVAVVCGTGNNAGDGYAAALMLTEAGTACEILLAERRFSPDGEIWFRRCEARGIPVRLWRNTESLRGYGSILDCIFGTGFHGEPAGEAARMIRLINESGAYTVSADINSGLNGDNGLAELAVKSDLTVSVGSWKPGHFLNMAADYMKEKINREIGIPAVGRVMRLTEAADVRDLFPPRRHFSHKGDYGYLALIGGSLRYSGAIRLAALAQASLRAGGGVTRLCAPAFLCEKLIPSVLEATLFPLAEKDGGIAFDSGQLREALAGTKAAAFGMGAGHSPETEKTVRFLLKEAKSPLILDADGLNAVAALGPEILRERQGGLILTPHLGEFSRLRGKSIAEIRQNPVESAEQFARAYGVILLLKGPGTIVTDGTETRITDRGCPGMATAGSGDVLSGILAAMAAIHPDRLVDTAAAAAWLNGAAGEAASHAMGETCMTAGDTAAAIPEVFRKELNPSQEGENEDVH